MLKIGATTAPIKPPKIGFLIPAKQESVIKIITLKVIGNSFFVCITEMIIGLRGALFCYYKLVTRGKSRFDPFPFKILNFKT
jgi:hypothetical protein